MRERVQQVLLNDFGVSRETMARLEAFVDLVCCENDAQNLIARGTIDDIWNRHILDSAQLVRFAPLAATWLDIGTGAGFPGLIVAAIHRGHITMVESRRLRADFLLRAAEVLSLSDRARIICSKLERVETSTYEVISARAFAPLDRLFTLASRFAATGTRWVLPKGKSARSELDTIRGSWQGVFHVEPSLTDPEAGILVAERVSRTVQGQQ